MMEKNCGVRRISINYTKAANHEFKNPCKLISTNRSTLTVINLKDHCLKMYTGECDNNTTIVQFLLETRDLLHPYLMIVKLYVKKQMFL